MIAIYFDSGELLAGEFYRHPNETSGTYRITDSTSLRRSMGNINTLVLRGDGWHYPISRIVKFKDVTEEELKSLRRDNTLTNILNETNR